MNYFRLLFRYNLLRFYCHKQGICEKLQLRFTQSSYNLNIPCKRKTILPSKGTKINSREHQLQDLHIHLRTLIPSLPLQSHFTYILDKLHSEVQHLQHLLEYFELLGWASYYYFQLRKQDLIALHIAANTLVMQHCKGFALPQVGVHNQEANPS